MPCFTPRTAWFRDDGSITFRAKDVSLVNPIKMRCGTCLGCRRGQNADWTLRMLHELEDHPLHSFITLTYTDQHITDNYSLDKRDWQLFADRLRKEKGPFRYYMCGEYGDLNLRPHYHAILFGIDFHEDRKEKLTEERTLWQKNRPHHQAIQPEQKHYRSTMLNELWGLGDTDIADVTTASIAYVARYTLKKANKDHAPVVYSRTCPITGETWDVKPEFALMSRRPGLGSNWIKKNTDRILDQDVIKTQGITFRVPKFYDKVTSEKDPDTFKNNILKRREAIEKSDRYTPERLKVIEHQERAKARSQHRKV